MQQNPELAATALQLVVTNIARNKGVSELTYRLALAEDDDREIFRRSSIVVLKKTVSTLGDSLPVPQWWIDLPIVNPFARNISVDGPPKPDSTASIVPQTCASTVGADSPPPAISERAWISAAQARSYPLPATIEAFGVPINSPDLLLLRECHGELLDALAAPGRTEAVSQAAAKSKVARDKATGIERVCGA
jgi:hypothetical protein